MGRHSDEDGDGIADFAETSGRYSTPALLHPIGESAPGDAIAAAVESVGYAYTDPVTDESATRISAADPDNMPDVFPEGWGGEPTERDRAAIDAGNA